jgi:hypothetical protein
LRGTQWFVYLRAAGENDQHMAGVRAVAAFRFAGGEIVEHLIERTKTLRDTVNVANALRATDVRRMRLVPPTR